MDASTALVLVKVVHTVVWAFFAACILAIPVAALAGRVRLAILLSGIVLLEVAVLAVSSMRCPLTDVAARGLIRSLVHACRAGMLRRNPLAEIQDLPTRWRRAS